MKDEELFQWCLEKKRDGLIKTNPNRKLCDEYMEKAREDLEVTDLLIENEHNAWAIITMYYAMYHSALALLSVVGYKSRNHTCTKIALQQIFIKHNKDIEVCSWLDDSLKLKRGLLKALSNAKELREQLQYEIKDILPSLVNQERETAQEFVREVEGIINAIKAG